ncbi:unnamed protein product [Eruca vesicaria subsp. sativa]|uniref:C2H2-type domain-containing protein n=1 Tax=Eruca vesicaria subsp. sativa TaxID=29727 RepID=A0ABC8KXU6_ERUVS|nr:unnamed protein product [Eruca vesicaria subsp. sativa]
MMSHTRRISAPNAAGSAGSGSRCSLTAVEEAALCLVAISKGERPVNSENWNSIDRLLATPYGKRKYYQTDFDSDSDDDKAVKYKSMAELLTSNVETPTHNNDEAYLVARENKGKKKIECDACGKVLGSYQALGGHRSNQKCKRLKICHKKDQDGRHECDVCGRVFESGQALGGHMKAHLI